MLPSGAMVLAMFLGGCVVDICISWYTGDEDLLSSRKRGMINICREVWDLECDFVLKLDKNLAIR